MGTFRLAILGAMTLTGCMTVPNPEAAQARQSFEEIIAQSDRRTSAQQERFPGYPSVGTTYLSYDPFGHGYQITYYETPGRSWLWYGGNRVALPASWEVVTKETGENGQPLADPFRKSLCFQYPSTSTNGVSGERGGKPQCSLLSNLLNFTVASLQGDVFGLASGKVPYVRRKCDAPDEFDLPPVSAFGSPLPDCEKAEEVQQAELGR